MESWLTPNGTTFPEGANDAFDPRVQVGSYFCVATVKADDVACRDGQWVVPYWMTNSPGDFGDDDGGHPEPTIRSIPDAPFERGPDWC